MPGYALPTPSTSASWVTNIASGGSSGSISTPTSGSSSSGAGFINKLGFCCQNSSVGSVGSIKPTISTSTRAGLDIDGVNWTVYPISTSNALMESTPTTASSLGKPPPT